MRIFVDAMGGDYAPQAPVEGTIEALRRFPEIEEDEPVYRLLCNEYPPAK